VKVLNEPLGLKPSMLALSTATLWGGNQIAIVLGLQGVPPIALAGLRFVLGGVTVLAWALLTRIPLRPESGERRGLLYLILLFLAQIYLLNAGTQYTLAGRSTIFISTYPFYTALFAHFFIPGDRLSPIKVAGMALSFAGVALIFAESLAGGYVRYLYGDAMVLLSAVLLGARQVYTKRLTQSTHPGRLLLWQAAVSTPIFFGLSMAVEGNRTWVYSEAVLAGVLYQGLIIAGFCFILQTHLLRRYRASRLSAFGFVTPIVGVLFSNLLLGESVSPGLLASMVLVAAGITIVNRETAESRG